MGGATIKTLRSRLTLTILAVLLFTVALISGFSNVYINRTFENYIAREEREQSESIVADIESRYNALAGGWSEDFLHTLGMYSLYDGYIISVADARGNVLWSAENHDMTQCGRIMADIAARMAGINGGGFETRDYALMVGQQKVGSVAVTSYGPFFYTENDYRFIKTLNAATLIIALLAAALAVGAGSLLARRIAQPVARTAAIAAQIARGNYNERFDEAPDTRELNDLAIAVNQLAASLAEQENLRKRLTADAAHELRTPLTAVGSHLEAMIEGIWEATPERLRSCHEEVRRLGLLVQDLQELAKFDSDNLKLTKTEIDLAELVRAVCRNFEAEAAKKNIALSVCAGAGFVSADKDRMNQVVTNLVSNAVKYTPANGHISVVAAASAGAGLIEVSDDGIGIAADELPFVFERFYRTDKSRNRKTGGAGVGLTIAKSIVEAHGGTIDVHSQVDAGSRFTVTLPR
ncbi:MAG: HAMP domain-containing histidine kinase [Gracilibacteraceae bacterium]|nr:HAMP domain-containing histidine kinase [Gracilibacteraceae bacterium]